MTAVPEQASKLEPSGRIWGFMYALGVEGPPREAKLEGSELDLERVVKHDFWAATCFYTARGTGRRVVIKYGRSRRLGLVPMRWAGRVLVNRESRFYRRLSTVDAVPRWLGMVPAPWIGFGHEYVEGQAIAVADPQRLDASFFQALGVVLEQLHEREIAYVDLHKPHNVIIDPRGQPHLIDFQISYDVDGGLKGWLLPRALRRWLLSAGIRADRYHLIKHKKYLRPDLLTVDERARVEKRMWFIRLHAMLVAPYFFVRRRLLRRWRSSGRLLPDAAR